MAFRLADRVQETTSTSGAGTLTLAGAAAQYQGFAAIGDGNQTLYTILSGNGTGWETGIGTYTLSGTTLSRDIILDGSSGPGSAISLTGTSTVFCDVAARSAYRLGYPPTIASSGLTNTANFGGVATVTDTRAGVLLSQVGNNSNADNWRLIFGAAPTPPYTIKARIAVMSSFVYTEHAVMSFGWYDGTKFEGIGLHIGGTNPGNPLGTLSLIEYSDFTTSVQAIDVGQPYPNPIWLQLVNDATAVHFELSMDGEFFHSYKDENISGGFLSAYSDIFFGINPFGSPMWATLMDFERVA